MKVCYDNLWKILIEKKMNKTDLLSLTQMGSATLAKLSKNKIVSLEVLMKICLALNCNIQDVCEFVKE